MEERQATCQRERAPAGDDWPCNGVVDDFALKEVLGEVRFLRCARDRL
jgi:hypothetical protein